MGYLSINIEAKNFLFLRVEARQVIQIEERCKGRVRTAVLGFAGAKWLLGVFKELQRGDGKQMIYSTFREGRKAFVVQERLNNHGSYIEIVDFGCGSLRGLVVVPRGRNGAGWVAFESKLAETLKVGYGRQGLTKTMKEEKGKYKSFVEAVKRGGTNQADVRNKPPCQSFTLPPLSHTPETEKMTEKTMQEVWWMLKRTQDELDNISKLVANCLPRGFGVLTQQYSQTPGRPPSSLTDPAHSFVNKGQPIKLFANPQAQYKQSIVPQQKIYHPTTAHNLIYNPRPPVPNTTSPHHIPTQIRSNLNQNPQHLNPIQLNLNQQPLAQTTRTRPHITHNPQHLNPPQLTLNQNPVAHHINTIRKIIQPKHKLTQPIRDNPTHQVQGVPGSSLAGGGGMEDIGVIKSGSVEGKGVVSAKEQDLQHLFSPFHAPEMKIQGNMLSKSGELREEIQRVNTGEIIEVLTVPATTNVLSGDNPVHKKIHCVTEEENMLALTVWEGVCEPLAAGFLKINCSSSVEVGGDSGSSKQYSAQVGQFSDELPRFPSSTECTSLVLFDDETSSVLPNLVVEDKSAWVLKMVGEVQQMVGIDCKGYEQQLQALFTSIEEDRIALLASTKKKGLRELKSLQSSINYDGKEEVGDKGRGKSRGKGLIICP